MKFFLSRLRKSLPLVKNEKKKQLSQCVFFLFPTKVFIFYNRKVSSNFLSSYTEFNFKLLFVGN
eukprot:UN28237